MQRDTKTQLFNPSNIDNRLNIAVIGSGISGLASAWFLSQKHKVTLFEKNDYFGGHTHTVEVEDNAGQTLPVDTGFIVYNEPNYPHLTEMLRFLKIKTNPTEMSFSVSINQGEIEYSGDNLNTLFAQRKNLFSIRHWSMISDIVRFNKLGKALLKAPQKNLSVSLEDFLNQNKFRTALREHYLLPMAAAIWSCPTETMLKFPVHSFLRFFENHGLLNIEDRPPWATIQNGSHQYIKEILKLNEQNPNFNVYSKSPVIAVTPNTEMGKGYIVKSSNGICAQFDQVVFASHANESLTLIPADIREEFKLLEAFKYQPNTAYLHSDTDLMPKRKSTWAAWNYLKNEQAEQDRVAVTYWMNKLQSLATKQEIFVSLNPITPPKAKTLYAQFEYEHPVFDQLAMQAQTQLHTIQGKHGLWFAGAYTGFGFHEDGLASAVNIATAFGIKCPWQSPSHLQGKHHA